jgi:hypothetical protein
MSPSRNPLRRNQACPLQLVGLLRLNGPASTHFQGVGVVTDVA